jgi:hypothetical protein
VQIYRLFIRIEGEQKKVNLDEKGEHHLGSGFVIDP